jgi:hypothetical protein
MNRCCPWDRGVPVDFVTPTLNRADVHEQLYENFAQQTVRDKRLFVLDESAQASRFLSGHRDPRVHYVHSPNRKITGAGQGGIAAARNRLMRMTSAPVIAHLDDDDFYAPSWATEMTSRLQGHDIAKLSVWNMQVENGDIYQWDTRYHSGNVYAIKGGEPAVRVEVDESIDPQILHEMKDAWLHGFGFSYVFRRDMWGRYEFPEHESTEDIPWIRQHRRLGARINLVSDLSHLVLHVVHPRSGSVNFPQRKIPTMAARMTGALPSGEGWSTLPNGKAIAAKPGDVIRVLARLKDKHTLKSVFQRCSFWKVEVLEAQDKVDPSKFSAGAAPSGYRLIHIVGKVGQSGTIPWGVPAPLNVFDKSAIVSAWRKAA